MKSFSIHSKKYGTFQILVDDKDFERVIEHKWSIRRCSSDTTWYVKRRIKITGKFQYLHRFIMNIEDSNIFIDHINGNGLDNQTNNLRIATPIESSRNTKVHKDSKTGKKGVSCVGRKFRARIMVNGKPFELGSFDTIDAASEAYEKKAEELFGPFYKKESNTL